VNGEQRLSDRSNGPVGRIAILGAGGLGTVLAGYLARAGATITLIVRPGRAASFPRAIAVEGLASFEAPVQVAGDPSGLGPFDYLLVCVKGRETAPALATLRGLRVDRVLSFQNGMGKNESLAALFGKQRVLGGLSMVGGTLIEPGRARQTLAGPTLVGGLDGGVPAEAIRLAELLAAAGLPAAAVPQVVTREWQKLASFLPGALVCGLSRLDMARTMLDPDLVRIRIRLGREVATVAAAAGHPLGRLPVFLTAAALDPVAVERLPGFDQSDGEIAAFFTETGRALAAQPVAVYPSLATDVIAGRPTELESTAGDLLQRAARHGVPVPAIAECTALLRGVERAAEG